MSAEFDLAFDHWLSALADAAARRGANSETVATPRIAVGTVPPPIKEGETPVVSGGAVRADD
ncbi:hypothetical protein BH11MYX2_BH11MYX2_39190 [soil metagenome]